MSERTFLRIRRRRNAVLSADTIRFDCMDSTDADEDDPESTDASHLKLVQKQATAAPSKSADHDEQQHPPMSKKPRSAIWRRVSSQSGDSSSNNASETDLNIMLKQTSNKKRQFRVLDAILDDGDLLAEEIEPKKKQRRRLTLIDGDSTTINNNTNNNDSQRSLNRTGRRYKHAPLAILSPCERLVDDSLQRVFTGQTNAAEHFWFVTSDPRLVDCSRIWLAWKNVHGNLLHACALWNDVDTAREVLSRQLQHCGNMLHATDAEGKTPRQVAELTGHVDLRDVLLHATEVEDQDDDFVYDLYCLEDDECLESEANVAGLHIGGTSLDCELEGGFGYWNDNGKLVLSHQASQVVSMNDENDYYDDDDDSNDEGFQGNEYPEEEDYYGGDQLIYEDDDDDDDGDACDKEVDDGLFDAAYGIYSQNEPEYDLEA